MNRTALVYLSWALLKRVALIALGFSLMLVLFDVLNNADQIEKRYGDGFAVVLHYMAFRFPEMAGLVTPFCILVAALLTLLGLAQHNEVLAFKAAGMSFYRMLLLMLPAAALVAAAHFVVSDFVTPLAKRQLARMELERPTDDESAAARQKTQNIWLRDGASVVQVFQVQREGRYLSQIAIYRRDAAGNFTERVVAKAARWSNRQWTLVGATTQIMEAQGPSISSAETLPWTTTLRPRDFFNLSANATQFTARELAALSQGNNVGTRPNYTYETWRQRRLALPVVAIMMLILAAPVAQARVRNVNLGARLAAGIGLGFLFFVTDGLSQALGESGAVLPAVSAWAPVAIFASIGASVLVWIEGV